MDSLEKQIALTFIPGLGDILIKNLISYCGSAEAVFKMKKSALIRIPGIGIKGAASITAFRDFKRAEAEVNFLLKHNIQSTFYLDPLYPKRLRAIADAPVLLYSRGKIDFNAQRMVGIVGTRRATEYGKQFLKELIPALKPCGCTVVSGMAFGIDIYAHRLALQHELETIGVMGHGLDRVYPAQHYTTAQRMMEKGGILAEFPSGTMPDRENFPRRNRIVAGLSDVLLVVETAEKGGAMITAEIANSYNKDIMALPGKVNDEWSKGCNKLIRSHKASMITCPRDLYELMNWDLEIKRKAKLQTELFELSREDERLVSCIKQHQRIGIDELSMALNQDAGALSLQLLNLEFRNIIRTLPGKLYEVIPS